MVNVLMLIRFILLCPYTYGHASKSRKNCLNAQVIGQAFADGLVAQPDIYKLRDKEAQKQGVKLRSKQRSSASCTKRPASHTTPEAPIKKRPASTGSEDPHPSPSQDSDSSHSSELGMGSPPSLGLLEQAELLLS